MKEKDLRTNEYLVLCDNCDTPASWKLSKIVGWVGCAPCITGESSSFDEDDLIAKSYIKDFLKELNSIKL